MGTSLVAQWIEICLPMQGTWVSSLVQEESDTTEQLSTAYSTALRPCSVTPAVCSQCISLEPPAHPTALTPCLSDMGQSQLDIPHHNPMLLSRFSRVPDSVRPHTWQPTRRPRPWDSPGKNTGVGCYFLLQCMKVKSESEVVQSCPTLSDSMDCMQPTRLLCPWGFPGKSTGVGRHCLLQEPPSDF